MQKRWPYPRLIVHRAGGLLAPENTLPAFESARALGACAVEVDVMMAADGVLMLSHDEELGRSVQAAGSVSALSSHALMQLDAGQPALFGARFAGTRMCTLAQALQFCAEHRFFHNLEIKPAQGFDERTAQALARVLGNDSDTLARTVVSSFSVTALRTFGALRNDVALGLLFENDSLDWLSLAQQLRVRSVHPRADLITTDLVDCAHAHGFAVMAWTVDSPEQARALLQMGVDALCTNRPDRLLGCVP